MIKQCLKCGGDFYLKPSKAHRKYCSHKCFWGHELSPRPMRSYVCLWCKIGFETNDRGHKGMYCSHACDMTHRRVRLQETAADRFWAKVDKNGPTMPHMQTPCWVWTGATDKGYGQLGFNGKSIGAHRLAYELRHGASPGILHVLHRCDNPPCCNPDHLFLGTNGDNVRDMCAKGRAWQQQPGNALRGSANPNAKLLPEQVVAIREAYASKAMNGVQLAEVYGVGSSTIYRVIHDDRYK